MNILMWLLKLIVLLAEHWSVLKEFFQILTTILLPYSTIIVRHF